MNSTISTSENQRKATVLVLRHPPGELVTLSFFLVHTAVEIVNFDCKFELENWLSHCVVATTPILAVIVDAGFLERSHYRFDGKGSLARRGIPLLVVDPVPHNRDWCRLDSDGQNGLTIYLVTMNLLPRLLEQLRGLSRDGEPHGKEQTQQSQAV